MMYFATNHCPVRVDYQLKNTPVSRAFKQADKEGRTKNLMWANGSSRLQYSFIGGVVTFYTTYRTNVYDMPLRLFVGDNNF
uniref:Protein FAR1-RELATED SEQUENCE n=2 Tax=Aegilops tauschii subsp. strangulata TaxID=200361 RepID=A0A453JDF9_AEGTS